MLAGQALGDRQPEPKGQAMTDSTGGTIDTTKMPYTVESDNSDECPYCLHGCKFDVIGPDGVALGVTFDDYDDARDHADGLSRAYLAGAQAAIKTLQKES